MSGSGLPAKRRGVNKPDKRGRDGRRQRKKNPPTGPSDCGVEQWAWLPIDLLASPAYRALSRNALCVVNRLLCEHVAEGGMANGELVVSHTQFEGAGATRNLVAQAICEAEAAGLIVVRRRGKIAGRNAPNLYRLTWLGGWDVAGEILPATHNWKSRTAEDVERAVKKRAKAKKERRSKSQSAGAVITSAKKEITTPSNGGATTPRTAGLSV